MNYKLGISAYYHDSAAALLSGGEIVAAAQEERFSRKKHDSRFPHQAIEYCLREVGISLAELDCIVFYDKPLVKFERLLETYLSYAPRGIRSFVAAMPVWLKEKLYLKRTLKTELASLANCKVNELPSLLFAEHHQSHAASAFFPSPFERRPYFALTESVNGLRRRPGMATRMNCEHCGKLIFHIHWGCCIPHSPTTPGS
jgi:carbamoyltransferase